MACTVISHYFAHVLVELLAVFHLSHVDEVDDYDATHVAEPELTGYLISCAHVYFQGVALLVVSRF